MSNNVLTEEMINVMYTPEVLDLARDIQKKMHSTIEFMMNQGKNVTYSDCVTSFLLMENAMLRIELQNIKNQPQP